MSAELHKIPLLEQLGEVNPDVIKNLENLLGWARLGAIKAVTVVAEKDGVLEYSCAGKVDRWRELGFLSHMTYKLNDTP